MTTAPLDRLQAALGERYRVERAIGSGGMASVYLAHDLRHGRQVAIKVLRPELAAALGADRFLREIQLTANLQHPHILPLFDSGEAHGLLFYVMPYVEGETLRGRLDREKRLPVADAVGLAGQVAAALDYAHRQGIVHRDIKPENILLHDGSALVADFGIALAAGDLDDRITATGISLGTPYYMSPEQALGQSDVDLRCDVYALGAMLYELLTGAPPFTGPTAQAIVAQVITARPEPPARTRPELPAAVNDAVMKALSKDPAARFPSTAAFQTALVTAAPRTRGRRPLVWTAAGVLLAAALGLWVGMRGGGREAGGAAAAAAAPRRIAVIPFRNASGDTQNVSFAEGLSLEINDALSRLPGLTILVASSARYRASGVDVAAAGRELDADAVLTGRVDAADTTVRVHVELLDVRTRALRWSARYDRPRRDLYMLEDTLSRAIATDLRLATTPAQQLAARAGRTTSPEAHALLVQARGNAEQRTPSGTGAAITLFTAAINLDSGYALAWAGRARAEMLAGVYQNQAQTAVFGAARSDAMRALALDSAVAGAHTTLGAIHVFYDRDLPAAAGEFRRALALDSTEAPTWLFRAWYFVAMDQMDSAAASVRTAMRLDPVDPIYDTRLATILLLAGDFAGAETALAGALRKDSTYGLAQVQLAEVLADDHQCVRALAEVHRRAPGILKWESAYAAARCGEPALARGFVAAIEARPDEPHDAIVLAMLYAALGEKATMYRWLERAGPEHASLLFMLRRNPAFAPYHAESRFQALVRDAYAS